MFACNKILQKCVYYRIHLARKLLVSKHYFAKLLDLLVRIVLQLILTFANVILPRNALRFNDVEQMYFIKKRRLAIVLSFFPFKNFYSGHVSSIIKEPRGAFTCDDL